MDAQIDTKQIAPSGATTGQALVFNGVNWAPDALSGMRWFETLALMGAAPGPSVSTLAWQVETAAAYEFLPGDVTAVDGWTSVANTGGTNGRWLLRGARVALAPRGGGLDDSPRLASAFGALAGKAVLEPYGSFLIKTSLYDNGLLGGIPSHTRMECAPGCRFTSSLPPGGTFTNAVAFLARHTFGTGVENTTLHLASVIGDSFFNSVTAITPGQWVFLGDRKSVV